MAPISSVFKSIFDTLSPTTHRDTIAAPLVEAVAAPFQRSLELYPWAVPDIHRPFLTEAGITISDFGSTTHSHPVHKVLETHLLHEVWHHQAKIPSGVVFMKPEKFEKLQKKNQNFMGLYNYRITPKDTTRYPETSISLPKETRVFMHDALMYYSPAQIADLFLDCKHLNELYCSLVVPPESDFTHLSLNPTLYHFDFPSTKELTYHLESNPTTSYTQPRSALDWLKTTCIITPDITLTVSILDAWGPVHSLLIQRGLAPITAMHDTVSFRVPDAILLPEANDITQSQRHRLVPRQVYFALFNYVRAVRTLRVTDSAGFIRTQASKPEYSWVTSAAWDNLQHFALHTSPHRPISHYMLFKSPAARLRHWAKTNEFRIFMFSALAAVPLTVACTYVALTLSRSQIKSFAILHRWIVPPPTQFNVSVSPNSIIKHLPAFIRNLPAIKSLRPPRFHLELEPRQKDLFGIRAFRSITKHFPKLFAKFQPHRLPTWSKYAILAAAVAPLVTLAYRWFTGPSTPQALHDQYEAYFHPDRWELKFNRAPHYTQRAKFLPIEFPVDEPLNLPPPPMPPHPAKTTQPPPKPTRRQAAAAAQLPSPPLDPLSAMCQPPTSAPSTQPASIAAAAPSNQDLPTDIVADILSRTSPSDTANLASTSSTFRAAAQQVLSNPSFHELGCQCPEHISTESPPPPYPEDTNEHELDCECPIHAADFQEPPPEYFQEPPSEPIIEEIITPGAAASIANESNTLLSTLLPPPRPERFLPTENASQDAIPADTAQPLAAAVASSEPNLPTVNATQVPQPAHTQIPPTEAAVAPSDQNLPTENASQVAASSEPNRILNLDFSSFEPQDPATETTVDSFGVITQVVHPTFPPEQLDTDDLSTDPTGFGPVLAWSDLHLLQFFDDSGAFLTRERNGPPATFPYPTNDCLLRAVSDLIMVQPQALWNSICHELPDRIIDYPTITRRGLSTDHLTVLATVYDFNALVTSDRHPQSRYGPITGKTTIELFHQTGNPGHFSAQPTKSVRRPLMGAKKAPSDLMTALTRFTINQGEILPFRTIHQHRTNVRRAKNLISNMKNGYDGILLNVNPHNPSQAREAFLSMDGVMDIAAPRNVKLIHIAGFAGCGKSHPIQQLLRTHAFKNFKVAVPTTELRYEWKDAMELKPIDNWRISTWESSLLKSARVLVIDEIYRMPRGYLDLAIHADSNVEMVILLGDPLQGEYHSSNPNSSNKRLSSEIDYLRRYIDFYCLWSRRIPQDLARFFGIPSQNPRPGYVSFTSKFPDTVVLTNSTANAQLLQAAGHHAVTIASSQGSTYEHHSTIMLDKHSRILSLSHSLIALTRSRTGIAFMGDRSILRGDAASNSMFSQYFAGQTIDLFDVFRGLISGLPIIRQPITDRRTVLSGACPIRFGETAEEFSRFGDLTIERPLQTHATTRPAVPSRLLSQFTSRPSHDRSDAIAESAIFSGDGDSNAPQSSTHFVPETRLPLHFDIASARPEPVTMSSNFISTAPVLTPVYPGENFETLAATFLEACDPDLKEIIWRDQSSAQFPYLNQPFQLSAQPLTLLAPIHAPTRDSTLLPASIGRRLRFRPTSEPYQISPKDIVLGTMLFNALCRAYQRDPDHSEPFDPILFSECVNENEFCQLTSKSQSVIMANADRSDPAWKWNAVRIFAKSQHKVNENTLNSDWKACQTLALMQDAVIMILGPVKKYQRVYDQRDRPANIYVHASHTPHEMSRWASEHLTDCVHLANDYTAFDQSQHGEAVVLEILKMRRLNIPEELIALHTFLKTNVETQFGPLTCMRLTGEPGTYDDNTDYNLAVLYSEYAITTQGVMVSGDDSLINFEPPTRHDWSFIAPLLALRFKKERSRYALFCGYYVGPAGAVRSPLALFAKLAIALDDKSLNDKLASYLIEFSVGHSLGQAMWNLIPVEQVMYQSANFDFFCRYASNDQKIALRLGEVPSTIIDAVLPAIRHLTYPVWSLLNSFQRHIIRATRLPSQTRFFEGSRTEGDLPTLSNVSFASEVDSLSAQSDPAEISLFLDQLDPTHQPARAPKLYGAAPPTAPPQMALPAELLGQLASLLRGLFNHVPAVPQLAASASSGGDPPVDAAVRLLHAPSAPSPTTTVASPVSSSPAGLVMPFQSLYFDITGSETKSNSVTIASLASVVPLLAQFRVAKLLTCEAVIATTASSMTLPQTIEAVWCTADQTISDANIMRTYGSTRFALGGPLNMNSTTIFPADLKQFNPILKDSCAYTDTPRFCIRFFESAESKKLGINAPICASVFLRGTLDLSGPVITPSA